jgi:hypothetical protein
MLRKFVIHKILIMTGLIFFVLACIPRENPPEMQLTMEKETSLPAMLSENSGMIEFNGHIWFINDSGNDSVLYCYDRDQRLITNSVAVRNAVNIDWEDITQNDNYVFIGDFGNNAGNRRDLRIIRIKKSDLLAATDTVIADGIIWFNFEDQTDFAPVQAEEPTTPFDCEAFIATSDRLIVFTKDWANRVTRLYTVPVEPGNYTADFMTQWNVIGLITAAAWSPNNQQLWLLGYTPVVPFIWVYSGFDDENLTYSSAKKTTFDYFGIQTEGLLITEGGTVLVSSETNSDTASLYVISEK